MGNARSLLPLALLAVACTGSELRPPGRPGDAAAGGSEAKAPGDEAQPALEALRAGDLERAHALLGRTLAERWLAQARALMEGDAPRPADALLAIDRALEVDARDAEAHALAGDAHLALAAEMIARGSSGAYVSGAFEDALRAYRASLDERPDDARAQLGAARAAHALLRFDEALDHARRGAAAVDRGDRVEGADAGRILAEIAYGAYADAVSRSAPAERTRELYGLARTALETLLGQDSTDPWVWATLSNLHLWDGSVEEARAALVRGLDRRPGDAGLLAKLVDLARANGGSEAALLDINAFVNKHPDVAGGFWWLGVEGFGAALAAVRDGGADRFEAAERAFQRARELDPSLREACLGWEVVARAGTGWARYYAGDLAGAERAFLSMNDVLPNGIQWRYEGDPFLPSGIQGLNYVGDAFRAQGDLAAAAEVYEVLRGLEPDNADWANNAGLFHRDDAVALEQLGRDLCRQAASPPQEPQALARVLQRAGLPEGLEGDLSAALQARADELIARARTAAEASYAAYQDAARLAPDDVRIVNDEALVMIYYVYRDLERAKELLRRCIDMGREQIGDPSLSPDAREALENAWGDAYQNMGFLHVVHRREPELARGFLLRSLELGDPRPFVRNVLLPLCDADPDHEDLAALRAWGRPCGESGGGEAAR